MVAIETVSPGHMNTVLVSKCLTYCKTEAVCSGKLIGFAFTFVHFVLIVFNQSLGFYQVIFIGSERVTNEDFNKMTADAVKNTVYCYAKLPLFVFANGGGGYIFSTMIHMYCIVCLIVTLVLLRTRKTKLFFREHYAQTILLHECLHLTSF